MAVVGVFALAASAVGMALAVHDEGFQLDGNTLASNITTGFPNANSQLTGVFAGANDWDSLFDSSGAKRATLPTGFLDANFKKDYNTKVKSGQTIFDPTDGTTYTTGSKDILPISGWSCVGANNVTDKGDIINAYSAVYRDGTGDRILYFAMEKHIDNGSNNVGFWFLADPNVGCAPGGTGNGNVFTGVHTDGDLLIVSEFSNGGGVSTIKAFRWNGGANGSLSAQPVEVGVDCVRGTDANQNLDMCATTNILNHTPIWPHASKTLGLNAGYPPATFFEGGINLTDTVFADSCFNGFLGDTRSSPETSATLYDFTQGSIAACGSLKITKVTGPDTTDAQDFSFATTEPAGKTNIPDTFVLDTDPADGSPDTRPSSVTYSNVPPGTYTVDETSPSGWYLSNLVCTTNGGTFDGTTNLSTGVATITMGFGDNVECTYTNLKPSARISIGTSGTNKKGDQHTFTVTVEKDPGTGTFVAASGVTVTPSETGVGDIVGGTCSSGTTNASGQCTIIVDSDTATGTSTVNATATVAVLANGNSANVQVSTSGYGANNVSNVKTWVDARISIATAGTNKLGDQHTFTVTVEKDPGTGTFVPAAGVTVTPSESGVGDIVGGTCVANGATKTDANGQCTIIVDSDTATGTSTVHASATVNVVANGDDADVAVATNGYGANTVSNTKTWVDARISIATAGTNKLGDPHTFTVTVEKNSGAGWVPAANVTVTSSEVGVGAITGGTCQADGSTKTNASGQCTIIVDSDVLTGTSTVHASATVNVAGVSGSANVAVATNGYGANTVSNTKTWVDARITIQASATNNITESHTFTVTVEKDSGAGFGPAAGVTVSPTISGAVGTITVGTCQADGSTKTNASGQCTVVVQSNVAGSATVNATATVSVSGVSGSANVAVSTTGYGAHDISNVKTWVDGEITWIKVDHNGDFLGGAVFTVCRTTTYDSDLASQVDTTDVCFDVSDDVDGTDGPLAANTDQDGRPGRFKLVDLVLGTYTIKEKTPPPGYTAEDLSFTQSVALTTLVTSGSAAEPFVNLKLFRVIVITCNDITHELVDGTVTLTGDAVPTKQTITAVPAALAAKGVTMADLCAIGGAAWGGLEEGDYGLDVELPDLPPLFTPV